MGATCFFLQPLLTTGTGAGPGFKVVMRTDNLLSSPILRILTRSERGTWLILYKTYISMRQKRLVILPRQVLCVEERTLLYCGKINGSRTEEREYWQCNAGEGGRAGLTMEWRRYHHHHHLPSSPIYHQCYEWLQDPPFCFPLSCKDDNNTDVCTVTTLWHRSCAKPGCRCQNLSW